MSRYVDVDKYHKFLSDCGDRDYPCVVDCIDCYFKCNELDNVEKLANANYLAIEALERLIPLPPFNKEFPNGSIVHYCPSCREELELHPNFCDECGQAIDWGEI